MGTWWAISINLPKPLLKSSNQHDEHAVCPGASLELRSTGSRAFRSYADLETTGTGKALSAPCGRTRGTACIGSPDRYAWRRKAETLVSFSRIPQTRRCVVNGRRQELGLGTHQQPVQVVSRVRTRIASHRPNRDAQEQSGRQAAECRLTVDLLIRAAQPTR